MKIIILALLVILVFSDDSALDTKILVSIPQGELSKGIASIKSLLGNLSKEISTIKSEQANIRTSVKHIAEQEEKHYKQLEKALEKNKVELKDIPTATPSTFASTPTSMPEQSPSVDASLHTGVQRLIALRNGKAKWDSDSHQSYHVTWDVETAFSTTAGIKSYSCAGWRSSTGSWTRTFPVMIWYEFPSTHVPTKFAFRRIATDSVPKTWEFVGSKDKDCSHYSAWTTLCGDMVGDKKMVIGEEVGCSVPKYKQEPFKCLGISVYSTNNDSDNGVCLKAMRFWEI